MSRTPGFVVWTRRVGSVVTSAALPILLAAPAHAATSSIDYVEASRDDVNLVVSMRDLAPDEEVDLGTVTATMDGEAVPAEAEAASGASDKVQRTTVLAIDTSDSMAAGGRFEQAQAAAKAFLDTVPEDVRVGMVTFDDDVRVVQEPTTETEDLSAAIDDLELARGTSLYDGLIEAVDTAGESGSRSVLLLSDGKDTTDTPLSRATRAARSSKVKVDVVALGQGNGAPFLEDIAKAGNGQQIAADDPEALTELFEGSAQALASQILVTIPNSEDLQGKEGSLAVTFLVGGQPVTDEAFVSFPRAGPGAGGGEALSDLTPVEPGFLIPTELMYGGIAAAALGLVAIIALVMGSTSKQDEAVRASIEAYTRKGSKKLAAAAAAGAGTQQQSMTQHAVSVAQNVLENQKGLESTLGDRLDAAGMSFKPAEWLLLHVGVAIGLGLVALLLSGGNLLYMLVGLFIGIIGPWMYLSIAKSRRLKKFKGQLADTLQLMAGALSAGLSLAQSVDTVVREGSDPMAGEFRRALVETRLGVEIEDALSGVADRMQSVDFEWVVMAIRIQREVGGNLSELLNKVAETIREREYLERQVLTLSAEGRLSVWILGGLPPAFMAYLALANPTYVAPMFSEPLGWVMLTVMTVLLVAGIFWMKKLVKVDV
jgi:tight adherence protein B